MSVGTHESIDDEMLKFNITRVKREEHLQIPIHAFVYIIVSLSLIIEILYTHLVMKVQPSDYVDAIEVKSLIPVIRKAYLTGNNGRIPLAIFLSI